MLVECGFTRATLASDGTEFTFRPSLGRIATLGAPHEIVALYADLHGPDAAAAATYVLACLCDQDDPTPLIGGEVIDPRDPAKPAQRIVGAMPDAERVIIARHLMHHGIVGAAKPGEGAAQGEYSERFDASEYVIAARAHLGLSQADAEALSMSEFQRLFEAKFPPAPGEKKAEPPSAAEYEAAMKMADEIVERMRHG